MLRYQVYLSESEIKSLKRLQQESGKSRSELIREAIDEFLAKKNSANAKELALSFFGSWKDNDSDFEEIRKGFDRDM